jgi:hypothetical protein
MFEPKPKPGAEEIFSSDAPKAEERVPVQKSVTADAAGAEPKTIVPSSSSIPDFLQEKESPSFEESNPFEEPSLGGAPLLQERGHESESAFEPILEAATEEPLETEVKKETVSSPEPKADLNLQPRIQTPPVQEAKQELTPGSSAVPTPGPKAELKPETATEPRPAETPPAGRPKPAPVRTPAPPSVPRKEPSRPATEQTGFEAPEEEPSRAGRMILVILSVFLLLGAAGYGVYKFVLPATQKANQPASTMTSMEGLRIVNPSGSIEPNGDLLISGVVENVTDKERSGWYIVVDVYDAQGSVLNKIRLLNGKQIYTRKDYDVLSKRGVNVQDLKAKTLQDQGAVIPAKGSVSFEMRYVQPPVGIASFNAVLQPFDPIKLFKEIEAETR